MNFSLNSRALSCFLFIFSFLFSNNFVYGQQSEITENCDQVAISVSVGTTIISSDPSFNTQIIEKNIVTNGIVSSFEDEDKSQIIVVSDHQNEIKKKPFQSLTSEAKDHEKRFLARTVKDIEKRILEYKKLVSHNLADNIHKHSSNGFFSLKDSNFSFALPSSNHHHDSTKIYLCNENSLRLCPVYLYSFQCFFYNSKSLAFCFSKVFSVRPPPVLG